MRGVASDIEISAKEILRKFGTFAKLRAASAGALDSVDGVGPMRAQTIRAYLDRLDEAGLLGDQNRLMSD